jgi:hypothetical protein
VAIITFYLQSFLELLICAAVAIQELNADDFKSGNFSDLFAAVFVLISAVILLALPGYMFVIIWNNMDELHTNEIREKYGYIYKDLRVTKIYEAIFHIVYLVRRAIFVFILIYF